MNFNGGSLTKFRIATSEKWKTNDGELKEKTEWHRISVFGKQGENCAKFLAKGRQVLVDGSLQTSSYEKDGQTHYSTDVVARNVQFLGGKVGGSTAGHQAMIDTGESEDIPF